MRHSKHPNACLLSCLCYPTVLEPGKYAAVMVGERITSTAACLLGYYCPGGDPTAAYNASDATTLAAANISTCTGNTATFTVGATSDSDCSE